MKSRFGLLVMTGCCLGLAGCASWQNRAGVSGSPGSAASLTVPPPPPSSGPLLSAPGSSFNEPPPSMAMPPSDPFLTLPPSAGPSAQKLNLSEADTNSSPAPGKMYNLESSKPSRTASAEKIEKTSSAKSSTISRLAEKSDKPSVASASEESKPSVKSSPVKSSTLERLSRSADTASAPDRPTPTSLPRPEKVEQAQSEARESAAPAAPASADASSDAIDTTLLAQPVRKGADADAGNEAGKQSRGPQSSVAPNGKLFNGIAKPVIYPVSNPAVDERVDVTQFS